MRRILITGGSGFLGTNLVEYYLNRGCEVSNLDINPPRNRAHRSYWQQCDIADGARLRELLRSFQPELVLHMAARTDLSGTSLEDYRANTIGVRNVIDALEGVGSVQRVLFCSSMLVCRLGYVPISDVDFHPSTPYGESKVEGERIVRALNSTQYTWSILRPTSIWGPWFAAPYRSFFDAVVQGMYYHPRNANVERTYGFALNAVAQIVSIAQAAGSDVQGRTFYLGDYETLRVKEWADAISVRCRSKSVGTLPMWVFKIAAVIGDVAQRAGVKGVPMNSFRLKNMLTDARYNLAETQRLCPNLPYSLDDGVRITLEWMENERKSTGER